MVNQFIAIDEAALLLLKGPVDATRREMIEERLAMLTKMRDETIEVRF